MFISDPYQLAFIHNPKCGGTTIGQGLLRSDPNGYFGGRIEHPQAGRLDLAHLPLVSLSRYFSDVFEKVCRYDSYVIVREPRQRFVSAVLYYAARYLPIPIAVDALPQLQREALNICDRLRLPAERADIELAHFNQQVGFVNLDGKQVIRNIYAMEELPRFAADLKARHGISIDVHIRFNRRRLTDDGAIRAVKRAIGPIVRASLSDANRVRLQQRIDKGAGKTPESLYRQFLGNRELREFVDDYYRDDFPLYESAVSHLGAAQSP